MTKNNEANEEEESAGVVLERIVMPLGMTKVPYGYPIMFGDFLGFAEWAIKTDKVLVDFEAATGVSLKSIIPKTGLDAMIDKATGNNHKATFALFLDWLAAEMWGEEA